MNILRLSTLSLILGIAVITLSYVNPASAAPKPKDCPEHPAAKLKIATRTALRLAWLSMAVG